MKFWQIPDGFSAKISFECNQNKTNPRSHAERHCHYVNGTLQCRRAWERDFFYKTSILEFTNIIVNCRAIVCRPLRVFIVSVP